MEIQVMKSLAIIGLMASATIFISGCTSFNGISPAEKPGTYYIITNTKKFIGNSPGVLLCTPDTTGKIECKKVRYQIVR